MREQTITMGRTHGRALIRHVTQADARDDGEAVTARQVSALVYRQVRALAGHRDADELAQAAAEHAIRALPSFAGRSKLSTWTFRISYLTVRKHDRWYRRWLRRFALTDDGQLPEPAGDAASPDEQLVRAERDARVRAALDRLSPKRRTVVVLHDVEGLEIDEIADIVGALPRAVRSRLRDGRDALAEILAADPYFAGAPARRRRRAAARAVAAIVLVALAAGAAAQILARRRHAPPERRPTPAAVAPHSVADPVRELAPGPAPDTAPPAVAPPAASTRRPPARVASPRAHVRAHGHAYAHAHAHARAHAAERTPAEPDEPGDAWAIAATALRAGDHARAERAFDRLADAPDAHTRDAARLARAQLWLSDGHAAAAEAELEGLAAAGATSFIRRRATDALKALR